MMPFESQHASEFEAKLQMVEDSKQCTSHHGEGSKSVTSLVQDSHGRFRPSPPSSTVSSLKRRRDDVHGPMTRFLPKIAKRRRLRRSALGSPGSIQALSDLMDLINTDNTEPQPASRDLESGKLDTQVMTRSADPSNTHERSSSAEWNGENLPDRMPGSSHSEETEMEEMVQDIDDGDWGPGMIGPVGSVEGELASTFADLTVDSGTQFNKDDNSSLPNYPASLDI
jgi:hypothetical protein